MKNETASLSTYLEELQTEGQYWLLRQEAIEFLQFSENAFRKAAHRLIVKGKLKRIRGDFYTIVPLEYHATGSLPASWFIDALIGYLKQKYYVGLLTAASLQGSAHQQPMAFQVITDKPTRAITVGQVRIEFFYKKTIQPHFYQAMKTASGTMHVSTAEMTAFDLVRYMNASGQVNHVSTVLSELAVSLNPDLLAELLKQDDVEITAAQRLGYLLDFLQSTIDLEPLHRCLKQNKVIRRPLVAGSEQPVIQYDVRWSILVNETIEPDEL